MRLHEYQAKQLLASFHGNMPKSVLICAPAETTNLVSSLPATDWIVKAQIHAGGRHEAKGVRLVHSLAELELCASQWLGQRLVTRQTTAAGLPVDALLVEEVLVLQELYYVSILIDPVLERVVMLTCALGDGSVIEAVKKNPDQLMKIIIDPAAGLQPYQCRRLGFGLALPESKVRAFSEFLQALYEMFVAQDLLMVEINPLGLAQDGRFYAVDIKLEVDDNALYRHPELAQWRDIAQEDPMEHVARAHGFRYREMQGDIGCLVNGAGIALATIDILNLHGGAAANYLDVGALATVERVADAFRILLSSSRINAVLINIFGGIVHCDVIAQGIVTALREQKQPVPVFARLEGNQADRGVEILTGSGLNIIADKDLVHLTKQVVHAAKRGASTV